MRLWAFSAIVLMGSGASAAAGATLPDLVREVRSADYRGARAELQRLAGALDAIKDPKLAAYRYYWRGFAEWRRALNGFNESPFPSDLEDDLKAGLASFRAALAEKPDWIEARIGMVGCASGLLFLAKGDAERTQAILSDYTPVAREMRDKGGDNPRALWLTGGAQLGAPPPYGGDAFKAAATFRRGIEAALAEARQLEDGEPVWIPRWGGAENLMNLAYLYTHTPLANRDLALAYAEGALVAAPEWHYVRDILWPQIQALAPSPAPAGETR
jgi:hypothetical protein